MKKYIRSSKKFYGQDGEVLDIERESKTLTYDSSFDGDYYKGNYHIFVRFYDTDGNECLISKIYDDSISDPTNPYNLEKGKQYSVSGYYVPNHNIINNSIEYDVAQPRIAGLTSQNKSNGIEVVTKYWYPAEATADADRLCQLFDQNGIEYRYYGPEFDEDTGEPFPLQFTVCRSGKAWKDIQRLVNSVRYAKPKQEKMKVDRSGDQIRFRDLWI